MQEYIKVKNSLKEIADKEYRSNKRYVVVTTILSLIVLLFVYFTFFVYTNVVVDGSSMYATLENGDVLIANRKSTPEKGDIVIIDDMLGEGNWIIKRVIATGGDKVKIEHGKVYVNGVAITEPYAYGQTNCNGSYLREGQVITINENEYFFLGDNRENSSDSRVFGTAKSENIVGVVEEWSIKTKEFRNKIYDFFKIERF